MDVRKQQALFGGEQAQIDTVVPLSPTPYLALVLIWVPKPGQDLSRLRRTFDRVGVYGEVLPL